MSAFAEVLKKPEPHGHFVQLYDRDATILSRNVASYLAEGLKHQEGALVIATAEHRDAFLHNLEKLGVNTELAISESRLLLLDAERTLGKFMIDGSPDPARFAKTVSAAMEKVQSSGVTGVRAYGEMVGVLWTARQYTAAIRLEEFWKNLLAAGGFSLFCSYPIDIFAEDFQISGVDSVLCDHTHLIPTGTGQLLESAINRAMDERLGSRAHSMKQLIRANFRPAWATLPKPEATILWLRNNLPGEAEGILSLAREYYRAAESASASS